MPGNRSSILFVSIGMCYAFVNFFTWCRRNMRREIGPFVTSIHGNVGVEEAVELQRRSQKGLLKYHADQMKGRSIFLLVSRTNR